MRDDGDSVSPPALSEATAKGIEPDPPDDRSRVSPPLAVGTGPVGNRGRVSYSSVLVESSAGPALNPNFVLKDGVAVVDIPAELLEDSEPLWKCCLVGYFMNEAPHIGTIHATVNRIWGQPGRKSRIDVQFIGKTTVLFRIEDAGTRSRVLSRKFWHISEVPLMVGVWTPETASSPPDLSAMPLWVDLANVPGYLYSKKGLSFLSRTAESSLKSIRTLKDVYVWMLLASVLKTKKALTPLSPSPTFGFLLGVVCVLSGDTMSRTVWGLRIRILSPNRKGTGGPSDSVVLEGFSSKDIPDASGAVIMSTLMTELELLSAKDNLSAVSPHKVLGHDECNVEETVEVVQGDLVVPLSVAMSHAREGTNQFQCVSPNGFHVLQDLREEGEIDSEDEEVLGRDVAVNGEESKEEIEHVAHNTEEFPVSCEELNRGRGLKKVFANSRSMQLPDVPRGSFRAYRPSLLH
ncbi:hypothetical protein Bca52824_082258 [Brassica carinata]|uniref:DUF4283 domain-containing protein n=1 Tax=Brassica carinata TaxID=52824 RepID=A0A8X7TRZ7_BRACI|nr:hypothetical protein Bca52824_082258 [Brassica carinata]